MPDEVIKYPNRIDVFHHLTYDEITKSVDMNLFGDILEKYYDEFVQFCEKIKTEVTELTSISCYIENGQIHFVID